MYMSYRHASKGSKINTDLIDYVTKTIVKKEVRIPPKHVDTVVNSIQSLPLLVAKVISHPHKNLKPLVHCYIPDSSTYSCADQDRSRA